jgi:hypothetical protein
VIVRWAEYLAEKGFDPENQLCTDDFMGHLAHNTNLSLKAILGLASFARLCAMRGDREAAEKYERMARGFAARWVVEADDGDHFRLAFDRKGTWSQKYNLVWDRILGLGLFPDTVRRKEMDFYRKAQKPFGLPLDNRGNGAKLDWTLWTATLTGDAADFEALPRSGPPLRERDSAARRGGGLLRHLKRPPHQHAFAAGGRRRVPQAALRRCRLEEMGCARPRGRGRLGADPATADVRLDSTHERAGGADLASHDLKAARGLAAAILRRFRLAGRPRRLRHHRDAGWGRADALEWSGNMASP